MYFCSLTKNLRIPDCQIMPNNRNHSPQKNPLESVILDALRTFSLEIDLCQSFPTALPDEEELVYQAIRTVMRNHSEIFWFSHQWLYDKQKRSIRFAYTVSPERTAWVKEQIDEVVEKQLHLGECRKLSEIEQVMYVYKWIIRHCNYNIYSAYSQSIYSVFVLRSSVCTGYAKAAAYLFDLLGIESRRVFGRLHSGDPESRHCWNIVRLGNKWYHFDVCFGDPNICNQLELDGEVPQLIDNIAYNYFLVPTSYVLRYRDIEEIDTIPPCNESFDYLPYTSLQLPPIDEKDACVISKSSTTADIYQFLKEKQCIEKRYREHSDLMSNEIKVMTALKGCRHTLQICTDYNSSNGIVIQQATCLPDLLSCRYYKLRLKDVVMMTIDIAKGIQTCLDKGYLYRDIHVSNIYLDMWGDYCIGDFAHCVPKETKEMKDKVGSQWFMSPETYWDGVYDERSIVYSLGMIFYFLLNGMRPPFWQNHQSEEAITMRVKGEKIPRIDLLNKDNDDNYFIQIAVNSFLCEKCLSFKREYRIESVLTFIDKLSSLCNKITPISNCIVFDNGNINSMFTAQADYNQNETCRLPNYGDYADNIESFCTTCISPTFVGVRPCTEGAPFNESEGTAVSNDRLSQYQSIKDNLEEMATHSSYSYRPKKNERQEGLLSRLFKSKDKANSCVYAPSDVERGDKMLIQVFVYKDSEIDNVEQKAHLVDNNAQCLNYTPLQILIKKGQIIRLFLKIDGVKIDNADMILRWNGSFVGHEFVVSVPDNYPNNQLVGRITVIIDDIPIGQMAFKINVRRNDSVKYCNIRVNSFKRIFISYAHADVDRVKFIAEGYKALNCLDYFFDRHTLQPGDHFKDIIFEHIDRSDLFILCWSVNAAQSEWVKIEKDYALKRKDGLKIYPISIEPKTALPADMVDVYNFGEL